MELQGRDLSIQLQGADVEMLQGELRRLAFVIDDPAGLFGAATRNAVFGFQGTHGVPSTGVVDAATAGLINAAVEALENNARFIVRGHVREANGNSIAGTEVRAFDKDLRHEELLGVSRIDAHGAYEITYTAEQFRRAEKEAADLIVRIFNPNEIELAASPVRFNAEPVETVNLTVGDEQQRLSEYEALLAGLAPVLDNVAVPDLTDEDVTFLAGELGEDAQWIRYLVGAAQLAGQTGVPAEAFYGFSRMSLPTGLPELLSQHPDLLRSALQSALLENIIPARFGDLVDGILDRLLRHRVQLALNASDDPRRPSLGDLLSICLPASSLQEEFATLHLRHRGSLSDFWPVLRRSPNFADEALVDSLQWTFGLASLTLNQLSMIRALQPARTGDARSSLRQLAERDAAQWIALIQQAIGQDADAFPPEVEGADFAEKSAVYAAKIIDAVAAAFPTAFVAHRLAGDEVAHKDDLLRFFTDNPEFELASIPVQRYLAQKPDTALAGVGNRAAVTRELQRMERVFKLTGDYDGMRLLLNDGIDSAHTIATMGQEMFLAEYGDKLKDSTRALEIHDTALHVASMTLALYMRFGPAADLVRPAAIPDPMESPEVAGEFPEWKTLFGTLELCSCEHCRSVLSPAAYLVDILQFLRKCGKGPSGETPLQILLKRRSDIQDIELSCQNTNTPLPYIDLVIELLENAISPFGGAGVWQTRASAEQLSAYPEAEHFNPKAYATLADAGQRYPWGLPFDVWLERVRLYLDHVGVQYWQVLELYLGKSALTEPAKAGVSDYAIAAEYLHLTHAEWTIITQPELGSTFGSWGYNPADLPGDKWIGDVQRVSTFLRRSGLDYAELLELLDTDFIDPADSLHIVPPDGCDTDRMTIAGLSLPVLDNMHRFLRLWRKLGWSIRDLDKAITAFKPQDAALTTNLTAPFLVQLAHVQRLAADLGVPIVNILAWWAPIDTANYDTAGIPRAISLYENLFMNPALLTPLDPSFELGAGPFARMTDHAETLQAALGIDSDELQLLIDRDTAQRTLQLTKAEIQQPDLGLDHLSQLYRVTSLAKTLNLPVADFLSAKALSVPDPSIDPFHDSASTMRFIAAVRAVGASPFSIEQLDFLLRDAARPMSTVPASREAIVVVLTDLRVALHVIDNATNPGADPPHQSAKRLLALVLLQPDVEATLALIEDASALPADVRKRRVEFIANKLSTFLDPTDATAKLLITDPVLPGALTEPEARYQYVLERVSVHARQVQGEAEVIRRLAESLDLGAEAVKALLITLLHPSFAPGVRAIDVFLTAEVELERWVQLYRLLYKIAMIVNGFGVSVAELTWVFKKGAERGWPDLNQLPIEASDKPFVALSAWNRLASVYDLFAWKPNLRRDPTPGADPDRVPLFDLLFGQADQPEASVIALRATLATLTGWDLTDDTATAVFDILAWDTRLSFRDEHALVPLRAALDMAQRTQLAPVLLRKLCDPGGPWAEADNLMRAVRAGYDNGLPLASIKPVSDALREKQRSALIAYLVFQRGLREVDELFAALLIDVQMDACQLSSRIKQAISSVQLFVQRAMLNLEKDVAISRSRARIWDLKKNYRVQEAARQVFMFPENWVEPDLRDDKTPFFKQFEDELLQDEITPDKVEAAYLRYLDALDDIARPEICGIYRQQETPVGEDESVDILHVFGRTRTIPHIYYYRRREHEKWTAWEKVNADIQGNHLLPLVYERRLHLFWPIFTEKSEESRFNTSAATTRPSQRYWVQQLASSTYRHGSWTAKTVSDKSLALTKLPFRDRRFSGGYVDKNNFTFKTKVDDGVTIVCYAYHPERHEPPAKLEGPGPVAPGLVVPKTPESDGPEFQRPENSEVEPPILPDMSRTWFGPLQRLKKVGLFRIEGCKSEPVPLALWEEAALILPQRTRSAYQQFVELVVKVPDDNLWLPDKGSQVPVLHRTPGKFQLLTTHQDAQFDPSKLFFFEDATRTFFVTKEPVKSESWAERLSTAVDVYVFNNFYHPYSCAFIKQVNRFGVEGLLNPDPAHPLKEVSALCRQQISDKTFFETEYKPDFSLVSSSRFPIEDVDFGSRGAYSQYNWEVFFQMPLYVAVLLRKNRNFAESRQWFRYMVDLTDTDVSQPAPARYWKIRPFFENVNAKQTIGWLMQVLDYKGKDPGLIEVRNDFVNQVQEWTKNPLNPHLIARLRISAYQKTVVMKLMDCVIDEADQLFSDEKIDEATQLYVLVATILGERPKELPARTVASRSYRQLAGSLDAFSNASVIALEGYLPVTTSMPGSPSKPPKKIGPKESGTLESVLDIGQTLYFCTPKNEMLLRYWDVVADRLFKIRHCMNIEGVVRQLPLFEPPINPALLVRAAAAGLDLSSVLAEMHAPITTYRFATVLRTAQEFCREVQALGAALVAAQEKKDAEEVALLRSGQELRLLEANKQIKEKQIDEADQSLQSLLRAKDIAKVRQTYYASREFQNGWEKAQLNLARNAMLGQGVAMGLEHAAAIFSGGPTYTFGAAGWASTPVVLMHYGGPNIAGSLASAGRAINIGASMTSNMAAAAAIEGGHVRRAEEWQFQLDLATAELAQIEQQIVGAQIRLELARNDLENHELQAANARALDEYMRSKFTNQDLYAWMVGQLSQLYFQSYRLARDLAKRAERTFLFELGKNDDDAGSFIKPSSWDSLKRGLLAGEHLRFDLSRLEWAYLEQNKRGYELTKHISLAAVAPLALLTLKQTGHCVLTLDESLFDLDYPGHYLRRIKSVSLSIPCVAGPYTSVNCTLTLLSNSVRMKVDAAKYPRKGKDDPRFKDNVGAIESIATSSGRDDTGMFEMLLRDERFLPFEGAGVISNWDIALPKECNQFPLDTIPDLILQLRFTASYGGATLKKNASAALDDALFKGPVTRLFSMKHDFPDDWYRLFNPDGAATEQTIDVNLPPDRFPFQYRELKKNLTGLRIFLQPKNIKHYATGTVLGFALAKKATAEEPGLSVPLTFTGPSGKADILPSATPVISERNILGTWSMTFGEDDGGSSLRKNVEIGGVKRSRLDADAIEDIWLLCEYIVSR
jgi:hypothetical protein